VATSSGYDDIFVVIRMLIVLSELDIFDRGGTFGSLLIIPVDYWPFFQARGKVKAYWPVEE
jgi:hypothetical protein